MKTPSGAQFEIIVAGKPRSYRDTEATAIEAAQYLKHIFNIQTIARRGHAVWEVHGAPPA